MKSENIIKIQKIVEGYGGTMREVALPQPRGYYSQVFPEEGYCVCFPWGAPHFIAEYDHQDDVYKRRKDEGKATNLFVNDFDIDVFLIDKDWKEDTSMNPEYAKHFFEMNPDYIAQSYDESICARYQEEFGHAKPPKYKFSVIVEYDDYASLLEDRIELLGIKKRLQGGDLLA